MSQDVGAALQEIGAAYSDSRAQVFRIEAGGAEGSLQTLTGVALDQETLSAAITALHARFPEVEFDGREVRLLRTIPPVTRTVATNLTGLYRQASFDSELVSQLLNGWTLEVLDEQDKWCYLRQPDGYLGWAFRRYLSAEPYPPPTHLVSAPITLVMAEASLAAPIVTRIPGGSSVTAHPAEGHWSRVTLAGGLGGWVPAASLRPLDALPVDPEARRSQMMADAGHFIGVPYFWGGCTALGIDCSGFAQLLHRLAGVTIPRDADMQRAAARAVEPPYNPGDLFFFSDTPGGANITHVAVSRGGTAFVHSSRSINGVYQDDLSTNADLNARLVSAGTFL